MRYVTIAEMRALDRQTIDGGVPAGVLMENAGRAVAAAARELNPSGGPVLVLAGYGNNGGDGLVVARLLAADGLVVRTCLVGRPRPFSPESEACFQALAAAVGAPERLVDRTALAGLPGPGPVAPALVVDAVFGLGVRGVPDAFYADLFRRVADLRAAGTRVLAVDVPSGFDADAGRPPGACVRADCTVTMGFAKTGFRVPGADAWLGRRVVVADIGLHS